MTDDLSRPHLLYISGDGVDYEAVEKLVKRFGHYPLGPQCWILKGLSAHTRHGFSEALRETLPALPEKSELYLCPLSPHSVIHSKQEGFGLHAWLKK